MNSNLMNLKTSVVMLLSAQTDLSNGEKQTLHRLLNIVDNIITDNIPDADITRESYTMIRFIEVKNILKGYNNKITKSILKDIDKCL